MRPTAALSDGIGVLQRRPAIVGFVAAFALLATASAGTQFLHPLAVYPALGFVYLLLPFFFGGILAYVDAALDGRETSGVFARAGKRYYLRLVGGGIGLAAMSVAAYLVAILVGVVLFFVGLAAVGGGAPFDGLGLALLLGLVGFLIVMVPNFLFQFFPAAIVLEDEGIVDSLRRSYGLVTANLRSVLGFVAIAFALSLLTMIPTAYLLAVSFDALSDVSPGQTIYDFLTRREAAIYLASAFVTTTIVGSITYPYYVAFFRRLPGTRSEAGDGGSETETPGDLGSGSGPAVAGE